MESLPREAVDMENFRPHLGMFMIPAKFQNFHTLRDMLLIFLCCITDSNRYYSFPSFDTWESDHSEQDHREPEMKSP